jgi:hypothetical protein
MIRYDQKDIPKNEVKPGMKKLVTIDSKHQVKITGFFLKFINELKVNGVNVVNKTTHDTIVMNPKISLEVLEKVLGKKLESKLEFIKEFYMYKLDTFTNQAYEEQVTAIQEFPYSFNSGTNENIITFEFIS